MANRYMSRQVASLHPFSAFIDCSFVVDSTNGNGLGIRNLKGPGVSAVYMNTSATPAAGNPNPAAGIILVQLTDQWFRYFGGYTGFISPVGTPVTATTAGTAYVIVSLGTATPAQFQAVGLPANFTPTVGQAFVATSSATIGGGATVAPSATAGSNIDHIEVLGDPNTSITQAQSGNSVTPAVNSIILQCFRQDVVAAPANNTTIGLTFNLSNSSVTVLGE